MCYLNFIVASIHFEVCTAQLTDCFPPVILAITKSAVVKIHTVHWICVVMAVVYLAF